MGGAYRRFVLRDHVNFVSRPFRREDGPLLDVGCGGALFGRLMADRAIGFSDWIIRGRRLRSRGHRIGVPVVAGIFSSAPFPNDFFAAITMFHVLEHLYDPAAYLQAAWRLLKPGGRLIVQVPNASSWQFLFFGEHWNGLDVPRHLINFRAHDLQVLLENCGFKLLRTKYFSLRDNPAGMASSMVPSLDPMARRVRQVAEGSKLRLFKDLRILALSLQRFLSRCSRPRAARDPLSCWKRVNRNEGSARRWIASDVAAASYSPL